jgi:phosphoglucosamine mutase
MPRYAQAKENVPLAGRALTPEVLAAVEELNAELAGRGRVLVRASGTEPLVRVLAEAPERPEAEALCGRVARLVRGGTAGDSPVAGAPERSGDPLA